MPDPTSADPFPLHPPASRSTDRERVLETAGRLFSEEGIRAVDLGRITAESGLTRGTVSKLYAGKDELVSDYLTVWHRFEERGFAEAVESRSPSEGITRIVDSLLARISDGRYGGYPFVVAAIEFPDLEHRARKAVTAYRDWYTEAVTTLMRRAGHPLPGDAADDFTLAHDGVVTGAFVGDQVSAIAAFRRAVDRILSAVAPPAS